MDKITIKAMQFYGYHGVFEFEQEEGQPFIVDLEMACDYTEAAKHDDLSLTVSYADVFIVVQNIVENERYQLIEALAYRIITILFERFDLLFMIDVEVKKPSAPIEGDFAYVSVKMKKNRFEIEEE